MGDRHILIHHSNKARFMGCACNQKEARSDESTDDTMSNTGDPVNRPPSYDEARRTTSSALWALCRGSHELDFDTQIEFPVTVHIYNLDRLSWLLSPSGLSAYHSEVDIMGTVFAFGAVGQREETDSLEKSGVFFMGSKNSTLEPQRPKLNSLAQALRCDCNCQLCPRGTWEGQTRCDGCCRSQQPSTEQFSCSSCQYKLCSGCVVKRTQLFEMLKEAAPLDDHSPCSVESRGLTFVETLYMGTAKMSKRQLTSAIFNCFTLILS